MHRQGTLKRRWHDSFYARLLTPPPPLPPLPPPVAAASSSSPPPFTAKKTETSSLQVPRLKGRLLDGDDDDLALQSVVPAVTVVVEGRSICHRINLHHHDNYQSLAKALRQMFLNYYGDDHNHNNNNHDDHNQVDDDDGLDLSNAVPGHLVAYEDLENDLLLAGDLSWKDFVRVAKRIRILPAKSNSKKQRIINNLPNSSQN